MKVARIINTGSSETVMYDLRPRTDAEYDLMFGRDSIGGPEWTLVPVPRMQGMMFARKKGKVKPCGHPQATVSDADFADCNKPRSPNIVISSLGFGKTGSLAAALVTAALRKAGWSARAEDPAWFSCESGCCTALL